MQAVIYIKQSQRRQLAHMYEHIVCHTLSHRLMHQGLFPYIDYEIIGYTIDPGVVYVGMKTYTEIAAKAAESIKHYLHEPIPFDESDNYMIGAVISELMVEKAQYAVTDGSEAILRGLEALHAEEWTNLDDVKLLELHDIRKQHSPIELNGGTQRTRKMKLSVVLPKESVAKYSILRPLFQELATAILDTAYDYIIEKYWYYGSGGVHLVGEWNRHIGMCQEYRLLYGDDEEPAMYIEDCTDLTEQIWQDGGFARLIEQLSTLRLQDHAELLPSSFDRAKETGVLVGAAGWREIATLENCRTLLQHAVVRVEIGRKKIEQPLLPDASILS